MLKEFNALYWNSLTRKLFQVRLIPEVCCICYVSCYVRNIVKPRNVKGGGGRSKCARRRTNRGLARMRKEMTLTDLGPHNLILGFRLFDWKTTVLFLNSTPKSMMMVMKWHLTYDVGMGHKRYLHNRRCYETSEAIELTYAYCSKGIECIVQNEFWLIKIVLRSYFF